MNEDQAIDQVIGTLRGYRHKGKPIKLAGAEAYATVSDCTVTLYHNLVGVQGEVRVRVGGKRVSPDECVEGVVERFLDRDRLTSSIAIRAMAMELVAQQNISLPADDYEADYDEDYDEDYEDEDEDYED
jgi:hypothetical protein